MTTNLNELLGEDGVASMIRSWMAWSATNIIFSFVNGQIKLLTGVRSNAQPRAIPEPGDLALVGGFNTEVPGPAMFRDVADAHAKAQLGLTLDQAHCSGFLPCEFEMVDISEPLKTPNGELRIKRVAFVRVVYLFEEQRARMTPQGKIRDVVWMTLEEFEDAVQAGTISFPHQVEQVRMGFWLAEKFASALQHTQTFGSPMPAFADLGRTSWG